MSTSEPLTSDVPATPTNKAASPAPTERAARLRQELFGTDLSVDEVAHVLDLDRSTILRYLRDNLLVGYQIGREWRIREEELRAYVQNMVDEAKEQARRAAVNRNVEERVARLQATQPDAYWTIGTCTICACYVAIEFEEVYEDYGTRREYVGKCDHCGTAYSRHVDADDSPNKPKMNAADDHLNMDDIPF